MAIVGGLLLGIVGLRITPAGDRARAWLAPAPVATQVPQVAAQNSPATIDRPPILIGQPGDGEWTVELIIPQLHVREVFYRFEGETAFRSTGFERIPDLQTGLPRPRTSLMLNDVREDRVVFVKFIDSAGGERGPYRLVFDLEAQLVAFAKQVLETSKWVSFRKRPEKHDHLVYFSHLLGYKNALTAIRYSFDDETLARSVKFAPDASRSGMASYNQQDVLYVEVPDGTKFVAVQLRFIDGTQSPIRRFPVSVID